ncbi:hypothetical protein AYR62_00740 [Secundilactobacillus paracollinoides]|uniref:Uncharacterized protein n=1 Tax=Secundilactobacillus paracollinoides TaxID=240427 RepID=A0A1B2IVJ9_9LACO|nr:hypothetical protein [Secundilactobacillus paracollinoides]ANZ62768.1 hypothetical protein AYR62_00740 [Secundilactobacillus paracollinoides]ANZ66073.1 hypothetical protein AYR63_02200 [Secundilactobacillus paracollinoides]
MTPKSQMSDPDFQRLLKVALTDLTIRRTMLENEMQDVNEEMRSLEKDDKLDKLDMQIQAIRRDYDHYMQFVDPEFKLDLAEEYME